MQKLNIKGLDVGDFVIYRLGRKNKFKYGFIEGYSQSNGTATLDRSEDMLTLSTDIKEHIKFVDCNVGSHRDIKDNGAGLGWRARAELRKAGKI